MTNQTEKIAGPKIVEESHEHLKERMQAVELVLAQQSFYIKDLEEKLEWQIGAFPKSTRRTL